MKKFCKYALSFTVGVINVLFGAGGGIIAVSLFKAQNLSQKKAQASAVCLILPISLLSAIMYYRGGFLNVSEAVKYIPFGLIGAVIGTRLLGKLPDKALKIIFCVFMIYSGVRLLMR